MKKSLFIPLIVLTGIFGAVQAADRPNVVIILTDDQGWGDLSLNGNANLSTPNIDSLASQGAVFDRFFVSPVCSPTRAEVLTGRYHQRSGVYSTSAGGERMDLDEKTIAQAFVTGGYVTGAFGKWHNGMQGPYHPNARGFQEYYGFCSGHWGNYFSPVLEHNGEIVKGKGFIIDDLTDHAMNFIETNREKPFFVYIPYNTPHSPMQVPDKYWQKFKDHPLPLRGTGSNKRENLDHTRAALAMCENIDMNVGRLLKKLDELKLSDNTLVMYFSDNGPNGPRWVGGMRGTKGSTDEGGVRSPMIMRWPGTIQPGLKIPYITSATDLMPTLLEVCGLSAPSAHKLDGYSLLPLLKGQKPAWENRMIMNSWKRSFSARTQRFRIDSKGKLYDMIDDPGQTKNVANKHPEVIQEFKKAIDAFKKSYSIPNVDTRPFYITHPSAEITQIPARDGTANGGIKRSNKFPNCTFFTNWTKLDDSITWDAEADASGKYQVDLYYTCPKGDEGSTIELSFNDATLSCKIEEPHDPSLLGSGDDRIKRNVSYVKDFKRVNMGPIEITKGKGTLKLKALDKPGKSVIDFRMLTFTRLE